MQTLQRVNVLGVGVSSINMQRALDTIDSWITMRQPHYVCVTGVHGVMESQRDPQLQTIHNGAGLVTPDGMPLVWLLQYHGCHDVSRVYGPDLMVALCAASIQHGYRHFLYGATDEVLERLANNLQHRFPGLTISGAYAPPFRSMTPEEDDAVVQQINAAAPDIVWVGLSTPKQERWMAAHVGRLSAPALIGVGAAFDFHAGLKRQAPLWMQHHGLEWLFRLGTEPRRLWRRYLRNNPAFVGLTMMQLLKLRRFPLMRFGDYLVARGWASRDQVDAALMLQKQLGQHGVQRQLGQVMLTQGLIDETQVAAAVNAL